MEGRDAREEAEELKILAQQHRARLRERDDGMSAIVPSDASLRRVPVSEDGAGETVLVTDVDVGVEHTVLAERQLRLRSAF